MTQENSAKILYIKFQTIRLDKFSVIYQNRWTVRHTDGPEGDYVLLIYVNMNASIKWWNWKISLNTLCFFLGIKGKKTNLMQILTLAISFCPILYEEGKNQKKNYFLFFYEHFKLVFHCYLKKIISVLAEKKTSCAHLHLLREVARLRKCNKH